jgi:DNA-nicking Smr family endonuclease
MEHNPFAAALRGVTAAPGKPKAPPKREPKPRPPGVTVRRPEPKGDGIARHGYDDRMAFREAFAGVRPLGEPAGPRRSPKNKAPKARVEPAKRAEADEEVRARLDALVAGGQRFDVDRGSDGVVTGRRQGAHPSHLESLREGFVPHATLDLHGMRAEVAARAVVNFVRESFQKGRRNLLIIHGRGNGSVGGASVLREVVVDALTGSGASSKVLAFTSAPKAMGGVGALAIRLGER